MIDPKTATDAQLRRFLERAEPRLRELLGAPGELAREVEDLRTMCARVRIEQRKRYAAGIAAEIAAVAA